MMDAAALGAFLAAEIKTLFEPLVDRIAELEARLEAMPVPKDGADGRDGRDGTSVSLADVLPDLQRRVDEYLASVPAPKDGADGADGPPGKDGASVTVEDVLPAIEAQARAFLETLPVPRDGRDGTDGRDGEQGPRGEPGERGADGLLRAVLPYSDRVHYAAEVVTHAGSTWQALRDTGKAPGSEDWLCIARAGADADSIEVRGTYSPEETYSRLNIVALNGGSFIAKRNDPGECPGDGWQLLTSPGKRGQKGEDGARGIGERGPEGPPGPAPIALVAEDGILRLTMADGEVFEAQIGRPQ
jgi:hypothetical protein